jgi:hypothetical protein
MRASPTAEANHIAALPPRSCVRRPPNTPASHGVASSTLYLDEQFSVLPAEVLDATVCRLGLWLLTGALVLLLEV